MSRGKRLQFLAVAVVVLLLPFGWHWFSYVSFQQVDLTDRNFRLLGVTSQQIQAQIEYLNLSWAQMSKELQKACGEQEKDEKTKKTLEECIKRKISLISGIEKNFVNVEFKTPEEINKEEKEKTAPPRFQLERARDAVNLYLSTPYLSIPSLVPEEQEDNRSAVRITAKSDLGALLTPIVNRPEFDDVLMAGPKEGRQDEGEVLFQRASSGV